MYRRIGGSSLLVGVVIHLPWSDAIESECHCGFWRFGVRGLRFEREKGERKWLRCRLVEPRLEFEMPSL